MNSEMVASGLQNRTCTGKGSGQNRNMDAGFDLQDSNAMAAWGVVFIILATPLLVVALAALFVKGTDAMGDYLDQRGIFDISISKRPKAGKAYRHPPRERTSTACSLVLLGLVVLALVFLVVWILLSLPNNRWFSLGQSGENAFLNLAQLPGG